MEALEAGLDGTPLVLVQGPPGTGKTRTILNLLSVVMHAAKLGSLELIRTTASSKSAEVTDEARRRLWELQSPWLFNRPNPRDLVAPVEDGTSANCFGLDTIERVHTVGRRMGPKAHVLVCAPSNSALDEIVLRIVRHGLMDKDGKNFAPNIVRAGVNVHHSVECVSLDTLVTQRLGTASHNKAATRVERDRASLAILEEASIVFSTLSFAGAGIFYRMSRRFDVVVIDEAAQAVEPSILIPLVMGCEQVFLIGDPVQLPATVISTRATEHQYDKSMFKRLQVAGYPVQVLNVQYRMHPQISQFPGKEFYQGRLTDGQTVVGETKRPYHAFGVFGPLAFFDVVGVEKVPHGSASIVNEEEAQFVLHLYRELVSAGPELRHTASVAVISPYKAQVKLLRNLFR